MYKILRTMTFQFFVCIKKVISVGKTHIKNHLIIDKILNFFKVCDFVKFLFFLTIEVHCMVVVHKCSF